MEKVDLHFAKLLNQLIAPRQPARYLVRDFSLTDAAMDEMLAVAEEMQTPRRGEPHVRHAREGSSKCAFGPVLDPAKHLLAHHKADRLRGLNDERGPPSLVLVSLTHEQPRRFV